MASSVLPASAPLRAAMVRFTTVERRLWTQVAQALRDVGFDALDVPLVWREHERDDGARFDFGDGALDVGAMLDAARAAGLRVVARVGPMVSDDAPGLCLPERVLRDRACQARTRRQNPVLVPDPPRSVPLPSIASHAYQHAARRWVTEASSTLARLGGETVVRVIIGDGTHAPLRDDPFEFDHHPDALQDQLAPEPPHELASDEAIAHVRRETDRRVAFSTMLVDAALEAGIDRARVCVAMQGAATLSPAAHAMAARYPIALASPPPSAGTLAIWRQVRHAIALARSPARVHWDVWSGGPPYYPPTRGLHTVAAARAALAAGARDFTVRMGCAGRRWVGAVLSERGEPRPHAPLWTELIAFADALPDAVDELAAELLEPVELVAAARAATSVHPLPVGLLGLLGLMPGQLATRGARSPVGHATIDAHESALEQAEQTLIAAAVPVRRVPFVDADDATVMRADDAASAFVARATERFGAVAPTIDPAGAALVRLVRERDGRVAMVVLSQSTDVARVVPRGASWSRGDVASGGADGSVALEPGACAVFHAERIELGATPSPPRVRHAKKPKRARR